MATGWRDDKGWSSTILSSANSKGKVEDRDNHRDPHMQQFALGTLVLHSPRICVLKTVLFSNACFLLHEWGIFCSFGLGWKNWKGLWRLGVERVVSVNKRSPWQQMADLPLPSLLSPPTPPSSLSFSLSLSGPETLNSSRTAVLPSHASRLAVSDYNRRLSATTLPLSALQLPSWLTLCRHCLPPGSLWSATGWREWERERQRERERGTNSSFNFETQWGHQHLPGLWALIWQPVICTNR